MNNDASITTLELPASLTTISEIPNALEDARSMTTITVASGNTSFKAVNGVLYNNDGTTLVYYPSAKTDASFTVPDAVTTINEAAIHWNNNLTSLTLGANVSSIHSGKSKAMCLRCDYLESVTINEANTHYKSLDGVVFTKGVSGGDSLVFYPEAKSGADYTLPSGIVGIQKQGIMAAKNLEALNLNEATTVQSGGVNSCGRLKSVTIGANVTTLADGAFNGNTSLKTFTVNDNNANYASIDGVVYSKDKKTLLLFPTAYEIKGGVFTVPEGTEEIASQAFMSTTYNTKNTNSVKQVIIAASVTKIGDLAFRHSQIPSITFADNSQLTSIGASAFQDCQGLTEFTIPANVETIGSNAITYNNNLTTINVAANSKLKTISQNTFSNNKNLKNFNFLGSCELETIGDNAFIDLPALASFELPASCTSVGRNAFKGDNALTTFTFKDGSKLENIGQASFADCGLTSLTLPSGVKTIAQEAFRGCTALQEITLSSSITSVNPRAFYECSNLSAINVDAGNTTYSSHDGILLSKDMKTLIIFPEGKANDEFTLLPPPLTTIGEYAFYNCQKLKNITIPRLVTKIDKDAFAMCKNLNTVTLLCDNFLDPANINQTANDGSFANTDLTKVDLYVRSDLKEQYEAKDFYKGFKDNAINTSFKNDGEKEEYIPVSDNTVMLLSTTSSDYTYEIPTTTTHEGKSYAVGLISDFCFSGANSNVNEVIVWNTVKYIGANAFMTTKGNTSKSTIQSIFFIESAPTKEMLSTTRFGLDDLTDNYNEFTQDQKIYVKESALKTYQTVWDKSNKDRNYADQISYKIPGVSISKKYGTFSREFDVDFSEYNSEHSDNPVYAFVTSDNTFLDGTGDYGTSTKHLRFHGIQVKQTVDGASTDINEGTYVPQKTGVLLKIYGTAESTLDNNGENQFYYCIGNANAPVAQNTTNNIMHAVVNNPETIDASTASYYAMSNKTGMFTKIDNSKSNFSFPIHKSYFKIDGNTDAKQIIVDFGDGEITDIESIENEINGKKDNVYYNLAGQRVNHPTKGIYVVNGKKVIIK